MPTIKSAMTPFPYSIEVDKDLAAALEMMDEHRIHHLPVSDQGRLVGVVSKRDVETALVIDPDSPATEREVRSCYNTNIYVVDLSKPLDAVLLEMADRHIHAAVVVKGDKLAGIFTVTDACRGFADLLQSQYPSPLPPPDLGGGDDDQVA